MKYFKIILLVLVVFINSHTLELQVNAGIDLTLISGFKGSGPHDPNEMNFSTENVEADPGFNGFGLNINVFNSKESFIGLETGLDYKMSHFSRQDVEFGVGFVTSTIEQPSFHVQTFVFQAGLLARTPPSIDGAFKLFRPYAGVGPTYSIASVSDVNMRPEYGVGGESGGSGFGYVVKAGTDYLLPYGLAVGLEFRYQNSFMHIEKFRSFNIDGLDGDFKTLSSMLLFGKTF